MKKKFAITLACLLVVMMSFVGCAPKKDSGNIEGEIKNVIVMIGDGFGPNHLKNAKTYFGVDKYAFEDDYLCDVTTYSKDSAVTDSAASGSALATGQKFNNGEVGWHEREDIENLMEIAQRQGKKTGVLTSDTLHGATPGAYSAHTKSRNNLDEIVQDQINSGIDIMIGAHATEYDSSYIGFMRNGYHFSNRTDDFPSTLNPNEKYIAMFPDLQSPYNHEMVNPGQDWVDFPALIKKVLNYLDNENGFCLMIENGYIDKYSHGNQLFSTLHEVAYFAAMIEAVYEFCAGRNDTVVMITADHETGALQLANSKEEIEEKNNALYTSGDHSATNVHLFVRQPYKRENQDYQDLIDNTNIFHICKRIVNHQTLDLINIDADTSDELELCFVQQYVINIDNFFEKMTENFSSAY